MHKELSLVALFIVTVAANDCVPRSFGEDSFVCVCNATYCDGTPDIQPVSPGADTFYWYISTKDQYRLALTTGKLDNTTGNASVTLTIDPSKTYQRMFGWGGAFTDAAGINIRKLSSKTQDKLLRSYFDSDGSRYIIGRIPIAGTDFSVRPYTYDDTPDDFTLSKFSLAPEDYNYKIPVIKRAQELSPHLRLFASSWSAPAWMKTNNKLSGLGLLKPSCYKTYTDYILKFIEEYDKYGIPMWALTTGNEPFDGLVPMVTFNSMGWLPKDVARWVGDYLGPSLAKSKYNRTLILALDDQRFELPWYVDEMLEYEKAEQYTAGIAVHWYWDPIIPPDRLDMTHEHYPSKFLLITEACTGSSPFDVKKVRLGSWERGQEYMLDIIQNVNHWMVGWVDWNIALDKEGGPNWAKNFVDAPIIVNEETDEFFKQPMYYAIKHVSRFVPRNSVKIQISDAPDIKSMAFMTPSGEIVVVMCNRGQKTQNVAINDPVRGAIKVEAVPSSFHTIIYRY